MTLAFESFAATHDTRLSPDEIFELKEYIGTTSDDIRTGKIDGQRRKAITHDLGDYAILLANSDAPDFLKTSTLTMAAANTGSIELRDLALTQLGISYPTDASEVSSPEIRELNAQTQQEYVAAMLLTDKRTPYAAALQRAEQFVDFVNGRNYETDVLIPTEERGYSRQQRASEEPLRAKRRAEFAAGTEAEDAPYDPRQDWD